ncbi:MAG: DUF2167 domain-containing protein [Planctomycetota bacterium]|nr:DUF2167 domain-containing protein [Planctomycetota bacterium]MDA0934690.1 DUF2167 domain-containing protein [Planctomycetota bacterium]
MTHRKPLALMAALSLLPLALPTTLRAQEEAEMSWAEAFEQLTLHGGQIEIQGGKAVFATPEGWHYLHQDDARYVVEELWGNPPSPNTLGLIMPPGFETEDDGSPAWAIMVSYDDEGHYDDSDAASVEYDELLKAIQEDAAASNEERVRLGYGTVEIVGWAEPPSYDASTKKLYWAKHIRFAGDGETTEGLNYDVRVLGRRGTLVLRAVADMSELGEVRDGVKTILPAVEFVDGERYADYRDGIDPLVAGGIGALIGGKLLAKGGFLKLLVGLWKPIAVGLVAVGAFVMRMLRGSKAETAAE